jgi:hypothetical protein
MNRACKREIRAIEEQAKKSAYEFCKILCKLGVVWVNQPSYSMREIPVRALYNSYCTRTSYELFRKYGRKRIERIIMWGSIVN